MAESITETRMEDTPSLPLAAATVNLRRLCAIRALVLALQAGAALIAWRVAGLPLPYAALFAVFTLLALVTLATWWRTYRDWPVTDEEYAAHLGVDIVGLTVVLYLAGGASNPFISYYLVPLSIAAATLPWRYTWLIAGVCLGAYSTLLFYYHPLETLAPHVGHGLNLHVVGMWVNFLVSAALITYFVVRMAAALRQREQVLMQHREDKLRDEQLLAVATLAAGTAHELGTPLTTMQVVLDDLAEDPDPAAAADDIDTLRTQLLRCKHSLAKLVTTARKIGAGETTAVNAGAFFREIVDHWQVMRPSTPLALHIDDSVSPSLTLRLDPTVTQAVLNLLDNAADAGPDGIELAAAAEDRTLVIQVLDRGSGIPVARADQLGKPFVTTKGGGLGLGLFLSHATASRYGGSLAWYNREGGGSRLELRLPLLRVTGGGSD